MSHESYSSGVVTTERQQLNIRGQKCEKNSIKNGRDKINDLLKRDTSSNDDLDRNTDKLYQLADILFDLWLNSKQTK